MAELGRSITEATATTSGAVNSDDRQVPAGSSRGRPWGETMAVRGDFLWPSLGNCDGRPRGILVAACGEIAMAVDN